MNNNNTSVTNDEGVNGCKFLFIGKNRNNFFNPPTISDNTRFQLSYKDSLKKTSWEIVIDYFLEWMAVVLIGVLAAILFNVDFPHTLYFRLDDPSIQYPNVGKQTINFNLIVTLFIFVVPTVVIILFQVIFVRNLHDFHHLVLGTLQSLTFNMMFMLFFWFFYPAYRPNFLETCNPVPEKIIQVALQRAQPYNNIIYFLPQEICSNPTSFTKMQVNNTPGFPSGHASNLFSVWMFVVLYLFAKFKALSSYSRIGKTINRAISVPRRGWFIFPCIVLLIIGAAIWIGVFSRILDYEHKWIQVITGLILGFFIPIFVYSFKFGSAFGPDSHIPLYYYWIN